MSGIKWDKKTEYNSKEDEKKCDEAFAILTGITNWYTTVTRLPEFNNLDYNYTDKKGRSGKIELKIRDAEVIHKYDTLFIEPSKLEALTGNTSESLYLNFFGDYNQFIVFDIKSLDCSKLKLKKNVLIKFKKLGKEYWYRADRYLLHVEKGKFYCFDYEKNKYQNFIYKNGK